MYSQVLLQICTIIIDKTGIYFFFCNKLCLTTLSTSLIDCAQAPFLGTCTLKLFTHKYCTLINCIPCDNVHLKTFFILCILKVINILDYLNMHASSGHLIKNPSSFSKALTSKD